MGAGMTMAKRRLMLNEPHLETAQSDGILTLDTDMRAPLKALRVGFEPVQDLHGYDKPWPGGGGKNELNSEVVSVGYIRGSDGAFVPNASAWKCCEEYSPIKPSTQYILYKFATYTSSVAGYAIYDANETYISGSQYRSGATVVFTTPENAAYIRASWHVNASSPALLAEATETITDFIPYSNICPITGWDGVNMQRTGKADDFVPYQGSTTPISWADEAGTVYGGYLEWMRDGSVRLTATMQEVVLDGSEAWSIYEGNPNGTCFQLDRQTVPFSGWQNGGIDYAISNLFEKASRTGGQTNEQLNTFWWNNSRTGYRVIYGPTTGTGAERRSNFIAFLAENPLKIVGALATPVTYTLTPQEVLRTLRGENNLWSDANGAISATYWTH